MIRILFVIFCSFFLIACSIDSDISGAWEISRNQIDQKLPEGLSNMFEIKGYLDYTEMLFVDQQMVEYPLGFEQEIENWPTNNFSPYVILGNRIVFNKDTLDLKRRPNKLILNDFTFQKATFEEGEAFEYIDLQISYGGELSFAFAIDSTGKYDLYHSSLAKNLKGKLPNEEINYLKKLSRRIQLDDLNRFYNVTRTHSRTYELQIYLNGQMYQVQTEGVREAFPFGLKAFIRNANIAVEKQVMVYKSIHQGDVAE